MEVRTSSEMGSQAADSGVSVGELAPRSSSVSLRVPARPRGFRKATPGDERSYADGDRWGPRRGGSAVHLIECPRLLRIEPTWEPRLVIAMPRQRAGSSRTAAHDRPHRVVRESITAAEPARLRCIESRGTSVLALEGPFCKAAYRAQLQLPALQPSYRRLSPRGRENTFVSLVPQSSRIGIECPRENATFEERARLWVRPWKACESWT
jgi:hypothetical protein